MKYKWSCKMKESERWRTVHNFLTTEKRGNAKYPYLRVIQIELNFITLSLSLLFFSFSFSLFFFPFRGPIVRFWWRHAVVVLSRFHVFLSPNRCLPPSPSQLCETTCHGQN